MVLALNNFYPQQILSVPYSSLTRLNTLDVHLPDPSNATAHESKGYWIMYELLPTAHSIDF